jgi:3-O-methylgallate 3,4-dioxygenase
MGHAFAFIQRRIAGSLRVPLLPIFVNTYYPPNTPSAARCFALGRALGAAIATFPGDLRVAVAASGGLSHFVIDEALDRRVLAALESGDTAVLTGEGEPLFRSGSSEIKNWITVAGMLAAQADLRYTLLDYVPCVRSEAGTGNAMAFALWR